MNTETTTNDQLCPKPKRTASNKPSVSKSDLVLRALGRKAGASMDELCKLTDWQPHSVRGFLSGTARKKLGLEVDRRKDSKGISRYFILKPGTQL
jgi:hypothetical protein